MSALGLGLIVLLRIFSLLLIIRIVIEMVDSFSRYFSPPRWFALVAEPIFVVTDPPINLLRRLIPSLRLGNIALDISVIVLFLIIMLATTVISAVLLS